jgi:hypothetical protein
MRHADSRNGHGAQANVRQAAQKKLFPYYTDGSCFARAGNEKAFRLCLERLISRAAKTGSG